MNIFDLHCDALLRLWENKGKASFEDEPNMDVTRARLEEGGVKVQAFAIWIDPDIPTTSQFDVVLEQVKLFHQQVIGGNIRHVKDWDELDTLKDHEIGAILTLEGVDAIGNDLTKLEMLVELGVRSVGLTWNQANLAADGVGEPRGGGLTTFGKEIVHFHNERQILTDVSHLSERAFWDVLEIAEYPIATHSNAKRVCDHPRNLSDSQIKAMIEREAMIHVVYSPDFIKKDGPAEISDLIKHIDHICSLGGVQHVGLGSDFDGISQKVIGLEHAGKSQNLIAELLKNFSKEEVEGFAYRNFLRNRPRRRV